MTTKMLSMKRLLSTLLIVLVCSGFLLENLAAISSAYQPEEATFIESTEIKTIHVPLGTPKEKIEFPGELKARFLQGEKSETADIEVTWEDNNTYLKDTPGTYLFEPNPKHYRTSGDTPFITVVVEEAETQGKENNEETNIQEQKKESDKEEPLKEEEKGSQKEEGKSTEKEKDKKPQTDTPTIKPQDTGAYPQYPPTATDFSNQVTVKDWNILDAANNPISTTNPANPYGDYKFNMTWDLNLPYPQVIKTGDYFVLKVPKNADIGRWNALAVGWMPFKDGLNNVYGEWCIVNDGDDRNEIHVRFGENANNYSQITGISLTSGEAALKSYTMKGITQEVSFAGIPKQITFNQHSMTALTNYDSKYFANASDQRALWNITVNNAGAAQLAGDELLFNFGQWHPDGTYTPPDPYWQTADWGKAFTDKNNVYVEDLLDPGAYIEALYIKAQAVTPTDLPASGSRGGAAGYVPAFDSYLLMDFGGDLKYREDGHIGTDDIQPPTRQTSFSRVYQNPGETYDEFKARLQPYQYGIYDIPGSSPNQQKVVINFGKIGKNGDHKRYLDLTDTPYSGKVINGKAIPNYAVQAATNCIKNGYYTEADRDRLEEYFTEVYGEHNVIDGQVGRFVVELLAKYPPNDPIDKTNKVQITMDGVTEERDASGKLNNPSAEVVVSPNAGRLYKYDIDTNAMIQGAQFKLQYADGPQWKDYTPTDGGPPLRTTNQEGYVEYRNLPPGTYRFYEVAAAPGYSLKNSMNYEADLKTCVSGTFTIYALNQNGEKLYLWNKKMDPTQYKVEHYLEQPDGSYQIVTADTQTHTAEAGDVVSATANDYSPTHTFDPTVPGTLQSATVLPDGSLVLKLYYRLNAKDFVFYKVDQNRTPMENVEFYLYKCKKSGESGHTHSPIDAPVATNCWDTDNPIIILSVSNGKVIFSGLGTGEYLLVENKTKPGFELPYGHWIITVDVPSQSVSIALEPGETKPPAFYTGTDSDGNTAFFLPNYPQKRLAVTGGRGTLIFSIAGLSLIGFALTLASLGKKKKSKKQTY